VIWSTEAITRPSSTIFSVEIKPRPQGMQAFAAHQALRHAIRHQQVSFGQDGRVELLLLGCVRSDGGDVRARADLIGEQQGPGGMR